MIARARQSYYAFLERGGGPEPIGIVLSLLPAPGQGSRSDGRVVFELPVLLPDEQFIPLEWLRGRSPSRQRTPRSPQRN